MFHLTTPSLLAFESEENSRPSLFRKPRYNVQRDDLPLMSHYTGQSPDFPSWLRTIDNAVNSKKSNMTPIFEHSEASYWVKNRRTRYTWYLHNLLLEETCVFKNGTANKCITTPYHLIRDPEFFIFQTNITLGANLPVLRLNYLYESNENSNHTKIRTVQLLCCSHNVVGNHSREETFLLDTSPGNIILRVCSPHMCSPGPLLMTDFANTLATVWSSTLRSIIDRMTTETYSYIVLEFRHQLRDFPAALYSNMEWEYLISEGMGNQTAQNLIEFFKSRENSTSKEFLTLNTLYYERIASLPNHYCNIDTFMSIIENTTIWFRENTADLWSVTLYERILSNNQSSHIPMEQLFLDALLHSIETRRENGWKEAEPLAQNVSPNVTEPEVLELYQLQCMKVQSELLYGSKCGYAIESFQNEKDAIELLPYSQDNFFDDQKKGFVVSVGALISALLLVQVFLRYQQLPGGACYAKDEARMKRRRKQARMALNDEYLCQVREHHVRRHLNEEQAREAIRLFEIAALRDPKMPRHYQMKKRESSRKLVIGSHILLAFVGLVNSLQYYIFMEGIVLFLHMVLSLLEIKASKLKQEQIDGDMKDTQTRVV